MVRLTDNFVFGNKQRQLILSLLRELAQLDASHLSADIGRQIGDFGISE
jgi:hypothetical protein